MLMSERKRSQVTVFIAMGLIIIASLAFFALFQSNLYSEKSKTEVAALSVDTTPIKLFVESCMRSIGPFGLFLIGIQGGYIEPSIMSLNVPGSSIGYAYYEGVTTLVTLENIEAQFSSYMEENLPSCIKNFEAIPGYEIEQGAIKAETVASYDKVIVDLEYPLSIEEKGSVTSISRFSVSFPVRLKKIYDVVENIVRKEEDKPDSIDITYLKGTGMNVSIFPVNNNTIIYVIDDPESRLDKPPYTFIFANKFKLEDIGVV